MYEFADALERAGEGARALDVFADLDFDAAFFRDVPERMRPSAARSGRVPRRDAAAPGGIFSRSRVRAPGGAVVLYWDRNFFSQAWPPLHAVLTSNYIRGAISASASSTCSPRHGNRGALRWPSGIGQRDAPRPAGGDAAVTPVVCLITDRARVPGGADGTVACVTWAAVPGCNWCRCASAISTADP
jgi:hypothetical protein